MPIIYLSPIERITSTMRTWEWQHLKIRKDRLTGKPSESWDFFRNYTSLESALADVVNVRIRTSKHQDIGMAVMEVKDLMASVSRAITESINDDINTVSEHVKKGGINHGPKS